mmetsp:Transcript_10609/g.25645  ORF Transcript_10609/g.25645 Transcript_10609/m.25645 type:complete len:211 (+) Transcript_10609:939-1571(+)
MPGAASPTGVHGEALRARYTRAVRIVRVPRTSGHSAYVMKAKSGSHTRSPLRGNSTSSSGMSAAYTCACEPSRAHGSGASVPSRWPIDDAEPIVLSMLVSTRRTPTVNLSEPSACSSAATYATTSTSLSSGIRRSRNVPHWQGTTSISGCMPAVVASSASRGFHGGPSPSGTYSSTMSVNMAVSYTTYTPSGRRAPWIKLITHSPSEVCA